MPLKDVSWTLKNGLGTSLPDGGIVLLLRTCISFITYCNCLYCKRVQGLFSSFCTTEKGYRLPQTMTSSRKRVSYMKRERKQD